MKHESWFPAHVFGPHQHMISCALGFVWLAVIKFQFLKSIFSSAALRAEVDCFGCQRNSPVAGDVPIIPCFVSWGERMRMFDGKVTSLIRTTAEHINFETIAIINLVGCVK